MDQHSDAPSQCAGRGRARRGVTLIELLVAMSISGMVLIAILGIFGFSTRQLGTQTGRAETQMIGNQAMNAVCKEVGNAVSYGTDQNGDWYFYPPATVDSSGNGLAGLVGGVLSIAPSGTAVKFYPSDDSGATQGSNVGAALSGITSLWRATTDKNNISNGNPHWAKDAAWSQMQSGRAGPAGKIPEYPDVASLTFSTTGMPANTVRVTLVMSDKEGGQTSAYTISRTVYLANHN